MMLDQVILFDLVMTLCPLIILDPVILLDVVMTLCPLMILDPVILLDLVLTLCPLMILDPVKWFSFHVHSTLLSDIIHCVSHSGQSVLPAHLRLYSLGCSQICPFTFTIVFFHLATTLPNFLFTSYLSSCLPA